MLSVAMAILRMEIANESIVTLIFHNAKRLGAGMNAAAPRGLLKR